MIAAVVPNTSLASLSGEPNPLQQAAGTGSSSVCSFASLVSDLEDTAALPISVNDLSDATLQFPESPAAYEALPPVDPATAPALTGGFAPVVPPGNFDAPQPDERTPSTPVITVPLRPITAAAVLKLVSEVASTLQSASAAAETQTKPPAPLTGLPSNKAYKSAPTQQPGLMWQERFLSSAPLAAALDRGGDSQAPKASSPTPPTQAVEATQVTPAATSHDTAISSSDVPAPASPSMPAGAVPAFRPVPGLSMQHDLEQTIERLITARVAGRSDDIRLAIDHGAFGPVAIRLNHAESGLSAVLSSADPDFLPAVHAALTERVQAERIAAERVIAAAETIRADLPARTGEFIQNGRHFTDQSGADAQQHPASQNGSEPRKRMRPHAEYKEETLVSAVTQERPANGLFA